MIAQLALEAAETVIDIGCGTASLAIKMKQQQPEARVIGVDPDPQVLAIARDKVRRAGVEVEFVQAMGTGPWNSSEPGSRTKWCPAWCCTSVQCR